MTSFKRRLILTGAGLFLIVLLCATAVFFAASRHSFYLERSSRAQHVYASYLAVSDHTYRKLSAMGEMVAEGDLFDLEERYRNQKALRDALKKVRVSIEAELMHVGDVTESDELVHFNRIDRLAEEIIRGSEVVRNSVRDNDREAAREALDQLRSKEIEGQFNSLIDDALEEELREVRETERVARELNDFLTGLLPFLVGFFLLFGAVIIYATWHALTRSLRAFEQAVHSFRQGDFGYRIQKVDDAEFSELADAMNGMAAEIESQRDRQRVSQENLEALIGLRTRELESSNSKLEAVGEARKQFLADVSHELRTPLTIIQGEADIALRGDVKTPEQYIEALSRVREQTVHTTRLVQDLLFVARAENAKAPLHLRESSVVPIVQDICDDFRVLASERGIAIAESYGDSELKVQLDPDRFRQVVIILLDNAVKYSYRDSAIDVTLDTEGEFVRLIVADEGIGLGYHQSDQFFSRYYRSDEAGGSATGMGLGLPVARAIVRAHGGSIDLKGNQDKGAIATVLIPLQNTRSDK